MDINTILDNGELLQMVPIFLLGLSALAGVFLVFKGSFEWMEESNGVILGAIFVITGVAGVMMAERFRTLYGLLLFAIAGIACLILLLKAIFNAADKMGGATLILLCFVSAIGGYFLVFKPASIFPQSEHLQPPAPPTTELIVSAPEMTNKNGAALSPLPDSGATSGPLTTGSRNGRQVDDPNVTP